MDRKAEKQKERQKEVDTVILKKKPIQDKGRLETLRYQCRE